MPNKPSLSQLEAIRTAGIAHRSSVLDVDDAVRIACRRIRCRYTRAMLQEAAVQNHSSANALREAILDCLDIKPITDEELVALGGGGTKTGGGG